MRDGEAAAASDRGRSVRSAGESRASGGAGQPGEGGIPGGSNNPRRVHGVDPSALADAAALGLSALAGVLAGAQDGIVVTDADRCYV
ncbi:MAG: hypothetical protein ACRDR6_31305, partial [Pseudonocardiaceae bacterium]